MPGRSFSSGSYRYGFNGKENDDETGYQDYGMRIYDARLGKFLSVDPIGSEYPWNAPYSFAENRVINGVDLDGLEYVDKISLIEYTGSAWDYVSAVDNGLRNVVNMAPELWNSGVATYQSLEKGTYLNDLGGELKQIGTGVKTYVVTQYEYGCNTPVLDQIKDTGKELVSPPFVENLVTLYVGSKIPLPGELVKAKLKPSTTAILTKNKIPEWKGPVDYSDILDSKTVGPGKVFTPAQKAKILEKNRNANGGLLRSDIDGTILDAPAKDMPGTKTNMNSAQVDHKIAKSKRGTNSNSNAQVVSKEQNTKKATKTIE